MKIVATPTFPAAVSDTATVLALQSEVHQLREELASVRAEMAKRAAAAPVAEPMRIVPTEEPSRMADVAAAPVVRERATDPFFAQLWAYVSRPSA